MSNILDEWITFNGNIETENNSLVFNGQTINLVHPITGEQSELCSSGLFLNRLPLKQGKVSLDLLISEKTSIGLAFFLIYNFSNNNGSLRYDGIGVTFSNNGLGNFAYTTVQDYNTEYKAFFGAGIPVGETINLCLEIKGSKLLFYVKGVLIFASDIIEPIISDRIGFFCRSDVKVIVNNYKVEADKQKAFVIMKFEKKFDDLYNEVIKPVCELEEFNYDVLRADENYSTGIIIEDIIRQITESSLIIADITPDNPNVFYELGYAHALNKPTILLSEKSREHLPFDVSGFRVVFYDNTISGKSDVEKRLRQFLNNMRING